MKNFNTNIKNEEEWLTPPDLIHALGEFDLDPCAPPLSRRIWNTAKHHYSKDEGDGLTRKWFGRIWLNPPYGREVYKWLEKLSEHKSGIALIFARTDTIGFHKTVLNKAKGIFFFKGRIKFGETITGKMDKPANAPSCLVCYSNEDVEYIKLAIRNKKIIGQLVVRK